MLKVKIPDKISVPAVEKLIDYTASGIGSIAGYLMATRKAKQDAEVLKIQAQAQRDALDILGHEGADASVELDIGKMVSQRIQFQETKRLLNTRSVVVEAANQLGDIKVPSNEPDHDWTARFFNYVQDVSSDELQSLWTKVLVGEVERSGSTSLLTLDILRNLDRTTAEVFRRFCSACVYFRHGDKIPSASVPSLGGNVGKNCLGEYGLKYESLLLLNEHGLVVPELDSIFQINLANLKGPVLPMSFQGDIWYLGVSKTLKTFNLEGVSMTSSGKELSRIVEIEPMPEFTEALISYFRKQKIEMVKLETG